MNLCCFYTSKHNRAHSWKKKTSWNCIVSSQSFLLESSRSVRVLLIKELKTSKLIYLLSAQYSLSEHWTCFFVLPCDKGIYLPLLENLSWDKLMYKLSIGLETRISRILTLVSVTKWGCDLKQPLRSHL